METQPQPPANDPLSPPTIPTRTGRYVFVADETQLPDTTYGSPSSRRERARVRTIAALPSLLTIANGISGFAALVSLAKAYALIQFEGRMLEMGDHLLHAAIFIGIGMVCDMFDGRVARMTGTAGRFGAELDSLCDAVSFCLAPAMMLRVLGEAVYGAGLGRDATMSVRLLWAISSLYLACGLLRLARFNVETGDDDDHRTFKGLPSPAAAGAIISLVLVAYHYRDEATGQLGLEGLMQVAIPVLGAAFGLLMVSRIRYGHFFNRITSGPKSIMQVVSLIFVVALLYILFERDIPMVFATLVLAYVLYGPIGLGVTVLRRRYRFFRRKRQRQRRQSG